MENNKNKTTVIEDAKEHHHEHSHEHEEHHHEHGEECGCGKEHHHEHSHEHEEHHHEHGEGCGCGKEHHTDSSNNKKGQFTNTVKKVWKVSNLDCANCAMKVEEAIIALPFVESAVLRFDLGKLTVEMSDEKYIADIEKCAKDKESDIVLELVGNKKYKKEYIVKNIDCANCAMKVEEALNSLNGIEAIYRFDLEKLTISSNLEINDDLIIKTIKNKEPDAIVNIKATGAKKSEHHEEGGINKYLLLISVIVYLFVEVANVDPLVSTVVLGIIYIVIGGKVLLKAYRNILKGDIFDENFLMAIATIGAIIIQQYDEAVAVMLFYQVGEYFQSLAVNNSRKSIQSLMEIRPDVANVEVDGKVEVRACEDIRINDIIVVYPGNRIPLDGVVVEGQSSIDFSALTGESLPKNVEVDDRVMSGGVNLNKILKIRVTTIFEESTASKILTLVEDAGNTKADTEKFITKFAKIYTPIVCLLALLLAVIPSIITQDYGTWIYRGLVFLVISCPCAVIISIPLSYFGGIGAASKRGILIKGSQYLEEILHVDTIACDKTGTLTKGSFEVTNIVSKSLEQNELLKIGAMLEYASSHPIGKAIVKANKLSFNQDDVSELEEVAGNGIKAIIDNHQYLAGNERLLNQYDIEYTKSNELGSIVYIAKDKEFLGYIVVNDVLKNNVSSTIANVKRKYQKAFAVFSGDNKVVVNKLAKDLNIDKAYGELLPQDKLSLIESIQKENKKVAFVGDGLNDAPVLSIANVGIAMGGIGSDAAIEASDIVLMDDDFGKIETLFDIAKFTKKIVTQNLIFVFTVKVVILLLGARGIANMWTAVFADVGVSVIAILNAMRILSKKY